MNEILFWNIILIELSLGWCCYVWTEEIVNICCIILIYINITFVCTMWIMNFGSKNYILKYRNPKDEPDVYRIIKFPSIGR